MPKKMELNCTKNIQFQNRFEEGIHNSAESGIIHIVAQVPE